MTTSEDIKDMKELFLSLDTSKDGFLSPLELKEGMSKLMGLSGLKTDWQEMVEQLDVNGDGKIDYSEFTTAAIDRRIILDQQYLDTAFKIFDADGNGKISVDELKSIFHGGNE